MKTCYIYVRVSTEEQRNSGYSPDNQIRQSKEYARFHGFNILRIFDDSGKSGTSVQKRYELQEMLSEINQRKVDAVIIYKIDRFARNLNDFTSIYNNFKAKGIKLISITEGDLMGSNSLIPNIFATVAQWESEVNSSRTKDALHQKFLSGWQPTRPPVGYRSVGKPGEKKTCEPDPYHGPIIKELFEKYATGSYSIIQLQKWLSTKNITTKRGTHLGHSVINNILKNPFYYGLIRWHGEEKTGKHSPLIGKNLFDTCQYVIAKHRDFVLRNRAHDFLLRGFIICAECGQRYTAEWHVNEKKFKSRGGKIGYYHCQKRGKNNCPAPYVEVDELEKQVSKEFKNMQFSESFINMVLQKAREHVDNNRKIATSRRQSMINQRTSYELRRNKLEDALLDNIIGRETYIRKHSEIQNKIRLIDIQISEIENSCNFDMKLVEEVLAFTRDIYSTYQMAPPHLKKHYLRFFYQRFEVRNKKIVKVIPTPIFSVLQANHGVIIKSSLLPRLDSNQGP